MAAVVSMTFIWMELPRVSHEVTRLVTSFGTGPVALTLVIVGGCCRAIFRIFGQLRTCAPCMGAERPYALHHDFRVRRVGHDRR